MGFSKELRGGKANAYLHTVEIMGFSKDFYIINVAKSTHSRNYGVL